MLRRWWIGNARREGGGGKTPATAGGFRFLSLILAFHGCCKMWVNYGVEAWRYSTSS